MKTGYSRFQFLAKPWQEHSRSFEEAIKRVDIHKDIGLKREGVNLKT